mgnify:CR=1 FL=1
MRNKTLITSKGNNSAIVVCLKNVRPHPNADRLKLATVVGDQVIVGLDAKDGDVMIYFDSNLCLSSEYLRANNLYSSSELNQDTTKKGYFGSNGRVRAQKLRGEMSHGYVAPIDSLIACGAIKSYDEIDLQEGNEFTHVGGMEICRKYIVPQKVSGNQQCNKRTKSPKSEMFWKHWDTGHLLREGYRIPYDQYIYIEEKVHGSSGRTCHVLCPTNRPWWKVWVPKEEWNVLSGTRRVDGIGGHLPQERKEIHDMLAPKLHKGEQVYYEIYGKSKSGKDIQNGFSYGCIGGEYRVMLYRVTITTPDGHCVDLSRDQVYSRAEELGLDEPSLLKKIAYKPGVIDWSDQLQALVSPYVGGKSIVDANTIREGVVVWFHNYSGQWSCLKWKSDEFLRFESNQKDMGEGDVEDIL